MNGKIPDYLVEFSVDFLKTKLFKKVPELQRINGHNFCASPLPAISETNHTTNHVYYTGCKGAN